MRPHRLIALLLLAAPAIAACKDTARNTHEAAAADTPAAVAPATPGTAANAAATPGPIEVPPAVRGAVSFQEGFAPIVERLSPAVVNISTVTVSRAPSQGAGPAFANPFFPQMPRERREQALGSGVVVSEDGYVLTNNHVVEDATRVRVALTDRTEHEAKIIGTDPKTDIAVLKIDGPKFAFAPFGQSSKVRVGELALAIGNPFGIGQTVTMGIISATGRGNMGIVDYEDFIQTDAAINPGNSGGALINSAGELIGINTAILARGAQGNQGIGFAVPSELARAVMDQIIREGRVVRGWMGVAIQDVTPAMSDALGIKEAKGVLVSDVGRGSPAEKAGLARGDILVELDGASVADGRSFRMRVSQTKPGTSVRLGVLRGDAKREMSVVLGELPNDEQRPQASAGDQLSERLGIGIAPLTEDLRRKLNAPANTEGAAVLEVEPSGRAAAAGLRPGDVIQEVNRKTVRTPEELKQSIEQARGRALLLLVLRGGRSTYIVVDPD